MSQMPALARPSARVPRRTENPRPLRPALRVVPTAPRAPRRLPFMLLCSVLLAFGLMALLFLNIQLAQGSYALHSLQSQSTKLEENAGMLREDLAGQSSPAQLADRALKLGMVPGAAPAFLRLPDGQVLGVPQPAASPAAPPAADAPTSGASTASPRASGSAPATTGATAQSTPRATSPSTPTSQAPSSTASASVGR